METTLKEFGSSSGLRLGGTWTTLIVAQVALAVAGLPIAVAAFWGEHQRRDHDAGVRDRDRILPQRSRAIRSRQPGVDPETVSRATPRPGRRSCGPISSRASKRSRRSKTSRWREAFPATSRPRKSRSKERPRRRPVRHSATSTRCRAISSRRSASPLIAGRLSSGSGCAPARHVRWSSTRRSSGRCSAIAMRSAGAFATPRAARMDSRSVTAPRIAFMADVDTERWHEIVGVVGDLLHQPDRSGAGPTRACFMRSTPTADSRREAADQGARRRRHGIFGSAARDRDVARSVVATERVAVRRDGAAATARAAADGAGAVVDRDRGAVALRRRHLRADVVHGVAAPQGNRHPRGDGRRYAAQLLRGIFSAIGRAARHRRGTSARHSRCSPTC